MSRRKGRPMRVASPLPICRECPLRIWCKDLNFRNKDRTGKLVKVCPVWWMLIGALREKGILKAPPAGFSPGPLSSKDAENIMEQLRQHRMKKLGMPG